MFKNNLAMKFKNFFRENYKVLIFFIGFYLIFTFPLPYYVFTNGGISDLSNKFVIENGFTQEGSYNLSYVNQLNGSVFTYLLSCVVPGLERASINDYQVNENESVEEMAVRDRLMLESANQNAVIIAYTKAGKKVNLSNLKMYVMATFDFLESDKQIMIGDIITYFDGIEVVSYHQLKELIESHEFNDYVTLTFKRKEESYDTKVKIKDYEGQKIMGLSFYTSYDIEVDPKIVFNFSNAESGSSAGLMTTLAIYDTLIEEDLTNGLKIAGTGLIEADGTVGSIGGVEYKLGGAEKGKASIFFVPNGENYEEAIKIKKEKKYDIEVVGISTFDEAIEYLKSLKLKKE